MSNSRMSSVGPATAVGSPILGLLGILFIGLKLTGYITWSWWWVLSPFWGPWAVVGLGIVGFLLILAFLKVIDR